MFISTSDGQTHKRRGELTARCESLISRVSGSNSTMQLIQVEDGSVGVAMGTTVSGLKKLYEFGCSQGHGGVWEKDRSPIQTYGATQHRSPVVTEAGLGPRADAPLDTRSR